MKRNRGIVPAVVLVGLPTLLTTPSEVRAQDSASVAEEISALREELRVQREQIAEQARLIEAQQARLDALLAEPEEELDLLRGTGMQQASVGGGQAAPPVLAPVGEAPPEPEVRAEVAAIPQEQSVLTRPGRLVIDPSLEYTRSSTNRLVFRGFELIPGIQIGLIEATDADRDTIVASGAFRFGIAPRLEIEGRVPYVYRNDRIEVVQQRDEGIVRSIHLEESDIGDIELGLRYQLNGARPLSPIWIASLRAKSDTGIGPFDIDYDEFGVATGLSTGSGFWAVQPGLSFLLPSDPAVLYGGVTYTHQFEKEINRLIGGALVGLVDPGDAISANVGFGFALNPRFSFSLGYRHHYIFPTTTEIGTTIQESAELQIGSLAFGMSYRATARDVINLAFEFGVTEDAPDVSIGMRVPLSTN